MVDRIVFTEQAKDALAAILAGEIAVMSKKELKKFYSAYEKCITVLWGNPNMGKVEYLLEGMSREYRSIVLHTYVKMIYSIEDGTIYIHDFWNTLRNPQFLVSHLN